MELKMIGHLNIYNSTLKNCCKLIKIYLNFVL